MIKLLILMIVIIGKTLLCKGIGVGIFLLLFWMQGKRFKFNSDKWEDFFLLMTPQKIQGYIIAIYLIAALMSSAVSYLLLNWTKFQYSFVIAVALFIIGILVVAYKWITKEKDHVFQLYQEIQKIRIEKM